MTISLLIPALQVPPRAMFVSRRKNIQRALMKSLHRIYGVLFSSVQIAQFVGTFIGSFIAYAIVSFSLLVVSSTFRLWLTALYPGLLDELDRRYAL